MQIKTILKTSKEIFRETLTKHTHTHTTLPRVEAEKTYNHASSTFYFTQSLIPALHWYRLSLKNRETGPGSGNILLEGGSFCSVSGVLPVSSLIARIDKISGDHVATAFSQTAWVSGQIWRVQHAPGESDKNTSLCFMTCVLGWAPH